VPDSVSPDLAGRPFYDARSDPAAGAPEPWTLDDLCDFAARASDPYGGRLAGGAFDAAGDHVEAGRLPAFSLQLEAGDPPVWVGLDPDELAQWSAALERVLARWGVTAGDTVGFYEYGSSPLVLLSAGSYVPGLGRGATDRLGADMFCNDGMGNMALRMAEAIRVVRPAAVVLRADVAAPFTEALEMSGVSLPEVVRWVAVTVPDGAPFDADIARWSDRWGLPVRRLLRADAAFLIAGDCESCGLFHLDADLYTVEPLPGGETAVTTTFASTTPAVRYNLGPAEAVPAGCTEEPDARRLRWL
jgi:phenylacetate-coenzyme A ligase PaaK-like adenylate-forming protein